MSTQPTQPEALRLANVCSNLTKYSMDAHLIAAELRRLHAYAQELESQVIADCMVQGTPATGGEPVAWAPSSISEWGPRQSEKVLKLTKNNQAQYGFVQPLYTSPQPVREPLTPEQIKDLRRNHPAEDTCGWSYELGLRDGERAHGITVGQT